jgi:hypothetical protein
MAAHLPSQSYAHTVHVFSDEDVRRVLEAARERR